MAGHRKVTPDELYSEIARELTGYTEEIDESIDIAAEWAADELVSILRSTSPESKKLTGKKYKKGWVKKKLKYAYVIHNKNKPQLTHLLEFGHATRNGGRVEGIPHIKPAEEQVIPMYEDMVTAIIAGGKIQKR